MPIFGYSNGTNLRELARRQVRAKFPDLREGTSGWYRAVENRYRRLK
jgi:hypothetical protein